MAYILVVIIGLSLIWSVYLFSLRDKKSPAGAEADAKTPEQWEKERYGTLDGEYARQNGLWICPRCETLNEEGRTVCAACGAGENQESETNS